MMLQAMMQLDAQRFTGPMQQADGATQGALGSLGSLAGRVAALGGAYLSLRGIMGGFSKSITLSADTQDAEIGFGVLLGSAAAAKERVEELVDFAASTPFNMPEILAASRTLETLTKGALSTGDGLRLVGDVAAGVGQPFSEVSTTIGRLYDGLQSGRPVGEAMMRLQELGAISGDTRARIEALQKSGAAGDEVWAVASGALSRFAGMMEQKSGGWNGLVSTLKDNVDGVFRAFGQPVMEGLTGGLKTGIEYAAQLAPLAASFGASLVNGVQTFIELFKSGQIGNVIRLSLGIAFGSAMNLLIGPLASGSTWKGIGQIILAGFMGIGAGLIRLFSEPLIILQAGMDKVMDELFAGLGKIPGLGKALGLDEFQAQSFEQHLAGRRAEGTFLTRAGDESAAMASGMMQEGIDRVRAGMSDMTDRTGTAAMRAELAGIVDAARDSIAAVAPQVGEAVATAMQAPGAAEAAATGKKAKSDMDIASDRLAKIGLFVGGGQNATQTRLQERTARATERMGELMKQLINKDPGTGAAVWA